MIDWPRQRLKQWPVGSGCAISLPGMQFDPKEVAKKRLAETKAEAKAEQIRRETRGMKSISSLFGSYKCKGK